MQRWICRNCGRSFSRTTKPQVHALPESIKTPRSDGQFHLNVSSCSTPKHQIGVTQTKGAKNSVAVETRIEKRAAGATKHSNTTIDGNIFNYTWHLKKQGYPETTIETYASSMKRLHRLGVDLMNPDSVKLLLANHTNWKNTYKRVYVNAFAQWAAMFHIDWDPPNYKAEEKLPWIPTELEIDQLIAGCGKKTATFLQLLKETAMRYIEAWKLEWVDVDLVKKTVNVKSAKHGKPRILPISDKLIMMLKNQSKPNSKRVFGDIGYASISVTFYHQRKRVAQKLQNPRIQRITFHTLRHWKASMDYHRGIRLVELKEMLGHRSINSTMIYTHLIEGPENNEWISKVTRSVKGARALVEAGFEYVKDFDDGLMLFRKRK